MSIFSQVNLEELYSCDYGRVYGRRWNKKEFTWRYSFRDGLSSSSRKTEDILKAIRNAFKTWEKSSAVTFKEYNGPDFTDFTIYGRKGEHYDDKPFNKELRAECSMDNLAHVAFLEENSCTGCPCFASSNIIRSGYPYSYLGEVHFDKRVTFGTNDGEKYDLETIMLHQIGHLLGLTDSSDPTSIMYGGARPANYVQRTLSDKDKDAITALYSFDIKGPSIENDLVTVETPTLKFGAGVIWSTSNSNLQIVSGQRSRTATFKIVGPGDCDIYAQINIGNKVLRDTLRVPSYVPDAPSITGWPQSRGKEFLAHTRYDFYVSYPADQQVCETEWILRENLMIVDRGNSNHIWFVTGSPSELDLDLDLRVRVRNDHGWSEYTVKRGHVVAKPAKPGEPGKITSAPREHTMMLSSVKKVASVVKNDEYEIQLWNTNRMVRDVKSLQPSYDFDTENLSSGVYVVKVIKDGKVISSKKFIK